MSKMAGNVAFALLVIAFGAGTVAFGWWTVPLISLVWGGLAKSRLQAGLSAALAASLSWTLLLSWTATQGPVGAVARRVGGIFGIPGALFFAATLVFAALLAGSAAVVAGAFTAPSEPKRKR